MKARILVAGLLALIVAFSLTISTVRAGQLRRDEQAQGLYGSAAAHTFSLIQKARRAGLLASELAPVESRFTKIQAHQAPKSMIFWSTDVVRFYTRQRRALERLNGQIVAQQARVTRQTRAEAGAKLAALQTRIQTARTLDLTVAPEQAFYTHQQALLGTSTQPRQYRDIASAVIRELPALEPAIAARQKYVNETLTAVRNSRALLLKEIAAQVDAEDAQLRFMSLITSRATSDEAALASAEAAVAAQPTAFAAAVQKWSFDRVADAVRADYTKTIPAKVIVVSTERQEAVAYENERVVLRTPVTTGGPELPTFHGVFHIYEKVTPFTFHSPFPRSSPYYYSPTPVTYWMPFDDAQGLHDAWWRNNFGPGSNLQPTDLGGGRTILGTHGCVNLPMSAARFIWNWAPVGTTVVVN